MASEVFGIHTSTDGFLKKTVDRVHGVLTALIASSYVLLGTGFNIIIILDCISRSLRGEFQGNNMLPLGFYCVWVNTQLYCARSVLRGIKKRKSTFLNPFVAVNKKSAIIFATLEILNSESGGDEQSNTRLVFGISLFMFFLASVVNEYRKVIRAQPE